MLPLAAWQQTTHPCLYLYQLDGSIYLWSGSKLTAWERQTPIVGTAENSWLSCLQLENNHQPTEYELKSIVECLCFQLSKLKQARAYSLVAFLSLFEGSGLGFAGRL